MSPFAAPWRLLLGGVCFSLLSCGRAPKTDAPRPPELATPRISLFLQAPVEDALVGRGFFSHAGVGRARNHVRADDFAVETSAVLWGVRWWGHAEQKDVGLENFSHYTVAILPDAAGSPGAPLFEQTFARAATSPAATGRRAPVQTERGLGEEHVQSVRFDEGVELLPGRTYYVSIAARRTDPEGSTWQWADGRTRNAVGFSHPIGEPGWQRIVDVDSAFELLGERPSPG